MAQERANPLCRAWGVYFSLYARSSGLSDAVGEFRSVLKGLSAANKELRKAKRSGKGVGRATEKLEAVWRKVHRCLLVVQGVLVNADLVAIEARRDLTPPRAK